MFAASVMRSSSYERPWGKVDVHWTTEIVPGASCGIHGPTATVPWPFAQWSLQGQLRLVIFHIWVLHGTSRRFYASANQSAALVWPDRDTLRTEIWSSLGRLKPDIYHGYWLSQPIRLRPVTVRNRKLILLETSRCRGLAEFCSVVLNNTSVCT